MNLLLHDGNNVEDLLLKDATIPDPISRDNVDFKIFQAIIKRHLEGGDMDR